MKRHVPSPSQSPRTHVRGAVGLLFMGLSFLLSVPARGAEAMHDAAAGEMLESGTEPMQTACMPSAWVQQGLATWYGGKRWHGRRTASGERFDRHGFTAAHPSAPLGSRVRVVNLVNGREVMVRINDRGAFGHRFIIDLSEAAADSLGMRRKGRAQVAVHHAFAHDEADAPCR